MMSPLSFTPFFRPQVWGGRRLESVLGKELPAEGRFGEAWDLSSQKLHVSRVAEGPHAGRSLDDVWREFQLNWHPSASPGSQFPLLIKWLDCDDLLSVQVHPDDVAARRLLDEPRGKTEAWVIVHAEPGSQLYAGLKAGIDRKTLREKLKRLGLTQSFEIGYELSPRGKAFLKAIGNPPRT